MPEPHGTRRFPVSAFLAVGAPSRKVGEETARSESKLLKTLL